MKVDSLDRSILNVLRDAGRSSFVEIADRVGVTERTIRTRMKRLEEAGVQPEHWKSVETKHWWAIVEMSLDSATEATEVKVTH